MNWWKQTVFYQIYMPSFYDGNGDGIGDFTGIKEKIPYLKELGVGAVWLTPFYASPKVDNGYDISDYRKIDPSYGTMEDFEAMVETAHRFGIRVIADMVLNHSSKEHPWFQTHPEYYCWHKTISCNWESFFGGSAFQWEEERQSYYYHSFAKEQVDFNWHNPEVERELLEVLGFWLDKGIDGFRLDVINNLTLTEDFPDNPVDEKGVQQHLYDVNQPGIQKVFERIKEYVSRWGDIFLVGEISSDELPLIASYNKEKSLDTTFNFNLGSRKTFQAAEIAEELEAMRKMYKDRYPTLFFGSHDMPRFPSRFQMGTREIKLLALLLLTCRGIPFLYEGDEIGMKSRSYHDIKDVSDIQGKMAYELALAEGKTKKQAFDEAKERGRDYSRGVVQWENEIYAGFSRVEPWLHITDAIGDKNIYDQQQDKNSIWHFYQSVIAFRGQNEILQTGELTDVSHKGEVLFYGRRLENKEYRIILNFGKEEYRYTEEEKGQKVLFSTENISEKSPRNILPASEGIILEKEHKFC